MNHVNYKLDSYSILITSKYLNSTQDYINIMCVCKKFKETTEKLRFNPIPVTSKKLFPNIQTQYLYSEDDIKIKGIEQYQIWFKVNYNQYLIFKEKNIKCHHIEYSKKNKLQYGNSIPIEVTILPKLLYNKNKTCISIPNSITLIENKCFYDYFKLKRILLSSKLKSIPNNCFYNCTSLTYVDIPQSIYLFGMNCFYNCLNLTTITIPSFITSIGIGCFSFCTSLQSITFPLSLLKLQNELLCNCFSLTNINLPSTLTSIGNECFYGCTNLITITIPSSVLKVGKECFSKCYNLSCINCSTNIKFDKKCFKSCNKLRNKSKQFHNSFFSF
ncbi:hypothetical protein QTN25_010579 [Entamoeba marina]